MNRGAVNNYSRTTHVLGQTRADGRSHLWGSLPGCCCWLKWNVSLIGHEKSDMGTWKSGGSWTRFLSRSLENEVEREDNDKTVSFVRMFEYSANRELLKPLLGSVYKYTRL